MIRAENMELIDIWEEFYENYYRNEIGELAKNYPDEQRSLYIDWDHLYSFDPDLADNYIAEPDQIRDYAEEALRLYDLPVDVKLGQVHVRVRNIQERTSLADIRATHRGQLISVYGTIKNASAPRSVPSEAAFECQRCSTLTRLPQPVHADDPTEPDECPGCERQGPFKLNSQRSEFVDKQTLMLEQRGPDGADRDTESIVVNVQDDLVGQASIGDHLTITGVVHIEEQGHYNHGSLSDKYLNATAIESSGSLGHLIITEEDEQEILELAGEVNIYEKIVDSIAPSVYDNEDAKLALALQLFGGVTKHLPDGERIRGDIHVLLVGDPATGRSRLLRHAHRLAPRSMRVSGKTTTQAGLTATAHMAGGTGSPWDVEGGALVLADKGLTAIDRLDALRQDARETLPAILDEQSVHVTKATITETLTARTSVLAEAAPKYGRFDQYEPIGEQVDLNPDLISQFDLSFTLTDNPEHDEAEATHILDTNYAGEVRAKRDNADSPTAAPSTLSDANEDISPEIDADLLRRYIAFARQNCYPVLTDDAKDAIHDFYVNLRTNEYEEDAPIPVTSRKLEAIVRLAEASARMRLSDTVNQEDADLANDLVEGTLKKLGVDPETGEFDTDMVETGASKSQRERVKSVKDIIETLDKELDGAIPTQVIIEKAQERDIPEEKAEATMDKMKGKGDLYFPKQEHIRPV
jgi:replicative DNA helicase Mcm